MSAQTIDESTEKLHQVRIIDEKIKSNCNQTELKVFLKDLETLKERKEVNSEDVQKIINEIKQKIYSVSNQNKMKLQQIKQEIEDIAKSIKNGKNHYDEQLFIIYSKQLSKLTNRKNKDEIDKIQKLICGMVKDLKASSNPSLRKEENLTIKQQKRKSVRLTLEDIENKLKYLYDDIRTVTINEDQNTSFFLIKSIETLMRELHLIEIEDSEVFREKKIVLEKQVLDVYHKINKSLMREDVDEKEKKYLEELEYIINAMTKIRYTVNYQNYKTMTEQFNRYKNKLASIEDKSKKIVSKKSEIFDLFSEVERILSRLATKETLKKAEETYSELNKIYRISDTNETHQRELQQLRELVRSISEVSPKICDLKKKWTETIDKDLQLLSVKMESKSEKTVAKNDSDQLAEVISRLQHLQDTMGNIQREIKILQKQVDYLQNQSSNNGSRISIKIENANSESKNDIIVGDDLISINKLSRNGTEFHEKKQSIDKPSRSVNLAELNETIGNLNNDSSKTIENDLCESVDKVIINKNAAADIKKKIKNYKLILKQNCSNKDQELRKIREELDNIGAKIKIPNLAYDELEMINIKLTSMIIELDKIKDDRLSEEQQKLYEDIRLYFLRLMKLKTKETEEIEEIEKNIDKIKPKIDQFVGVKNSEEFLKLNEQLKEYKLKLDNLKFDESDDLYKRKIDLLEEIQKYNDILDQKGEQTKLAQKLVKEIGEMLIRNGDSNGDNGEILKKQINDLKINFDGMMIKNRAIET